MARPIVSSQASGFPVKDVVGVPPPVPPILRGKLPERAPEGPGFRVAYPLDGGAGVLLVELRPGVLFVGGGPGVVLAPRDTLKRSPWVATR